MGITALFIALLIVLIFLVANIPRLSLGKKILIVISVLFLFLAILAILFATQFDGGRRRLLDYKAIERDK